MNRKLLATAIGASLIAGGMAYAQANPAPQQQQDQSGNQSKPQTLQTITVTGTHIREAQLATAQPVIAITRADIERQGFTNVADVLQNLTVAGSPAISRSSVLASGEAVGGYYIDIHNLGASRTLVLLNGKRLGTTTGGLADLQQIPMSAIERIEVLKDGASAVYGSDAIGGVVNIITRNNFTGAEADAYLGQYDQGDGTTQTYSMTIGAKSDRGSVMLSAEYSKSDPVWARNRWFSEFPATKYHPNASWTLVSQYGAFFNYNINNYNMYDLCGSSAPLCTLNPGGDPSNTADFHPTNFAAGPAGDRTNYNQEMMLQTQLERKSLFVSGNYDITDHIHFQTDILYNHRDTTQQVAGYPFQPAFYLPGQAGNYIGLSPDSYFNPLGNGPKGSGAGDEIWFYRRGWEQPRVTQNQLTTYRIGGTLSGDFNIGEHNWNWDVGAYSNVNDDLTINHGDFSLIATSNALGPSYFNSSTGRVECGTTSAPIPYGSSPGSCVPWNPFYPAGQVGDGSLSGNPALQAYLFPYYHSTGRTKTTDYSADITGSLFTLPAGDLAVALGVESRYESGNYVPDAFSQAGLSTNLSSGPTSGSYNVKSEYLEVSIPILKDLPLAKELSADIAVRHSKYDTFGSTTNAKYSLTWRPIQDLMIAATFAHGFRAPQISDLYGGISGTFDYYTDPCSFDQVAGSNSAVAQRCTSGFGGQTPVPNGYIQLGQGGTQCASYPCQTGVQFFTGSNPNLQPELATNRTAQIVYSPSWLPSSFGKLDMSLDWFNIRIDNAIGGDSVQSILNDCYVLGIASRCSSSLFTRAASGVVNYALYGEKNSGWIKTRGWDLGVHYQLPQTAAGLFDVTWQTTYYSNQSAKADNKPTTLVDNFNGFGANFRYRSTASLNWSKGPFGATWTTRFYSSMKEVCSWDNTSAGGPECTLPNYTRNGVTQNYNRIGDTVFHDVSFHYMTPWNSTVTVGVNNIFDHYAKPSYSQTSSNFSYYGGFDIGRFYFIRYNQKF